MGKRTKKGKTRLGGLGGSLKMAVTRFAAEARGYALSYELLDGVSVRFGRANILGTFIVSIEPHRVHVLL